MDSWKRTFLDRLHQAQEHCAEQFESAIEAVVTPVFDDLREFLADNGFRASTPMYEQGRRSFKFELAENAYVLLIFGFAHVGEYELRREVFIAGAQPFAHENRGRVADLSEGLVRQQFQDALDEFINRLGGSGADKPDRELVGV